MIATTDARFRIRIAGTVQGVGFRPFIYRLATDLGLRGWVNNSPAGVLIDVEAPEERLALFVARIDRDKPAHASIETLTVERLSPVGYDAFEIRASDTDGAKTALVLPDLATCPECQRELFDPTNRRYLYPFTNCTHCGPRFTIIEGLPYDRPATTMKHFPMCPDCRAEYENPLDRRFHAQPNACPTCGPHLEWWSRDGQVLSSHHAALLAAAEALRQGQIVAVKGLGGFHLMVDGRNDAAVAELRRRKGRATKPLALMVPSLAAARALCTVSDAEAALLESPAAPIVLLRRADETGKARGAAISERVAPGNPTLGVMLPYTPLHHILMGALGFPVVATSGNRSGEPICTDEREALTRLGGLADAFLVHNRPITRHADDSIARVVLGKTQLLRRARGYAPLPLLLDADAPPMIAAGAHLKNTAAVAAGRRVFVSQHIGDMDTPEAYDAYTRVIHDFQTLYNLHPERVVHDLHPDYRSTQYARSLGLPTLAVQHHYAHILSCMAEHKLSGPVLGVAWDGTGLGTDGTIWGGEFLLVDEVSFTRFAHLQTFRLPGGEQAVREPRRSALGLLHALFGEAAFTMTDLPPLLAFSENERRVLRQMLQNGVNAPLTSSAGRLFDAVAALLGLAQTSSFEGEAAMQLEFAAENGDADKCYPWSITSITGRIYTPGRIISLKPATEAILTDMAANVPVRDLAARFHNTLTDMIVGVARQAGVEQVALSGGCFQNRRLLERTVTALEHAGFRPAWHQLVPTNDGGIAPGQIVAALREGPKCV